MKTPFEKSADSRHANCPETKFCSLGRPIWLAVLCWAVWAVRPRAAAQTPAGLDLQLYAGLSITGAVGTVYSIEYVTDLAQTNNASAWRCLEFLQLPASPYLWADKSAPATGKRFYRAVVFAAPKSLAFIPPGTFRMGSPTNEVDRLESEGPQTAVTISRGFWMGKYEVTQGEYLAVMGKNPSWFNGDRTSEGFEDFGTDPSRPVESVSWYDATNYCAKLTERERAAGQIARNSLYRLPTDKWEYACRAWTRRGSVTGMIRAIRTSRTTRGIETTVVERRIRWGGRCPTLGDCMTCMGMSGSGAMIGMATIPAGLPSNRKGLQRARSV